VQRLSPDLDALIAPGAKVERLGGGLKWAEGPVWVRNGSYLLFSDPPMNTMYRWSRAHGIEPFLHPSGYAGADTAALREAGSNGLAVDAAGALIVCDSGNRGLARLDLKTKRKEIFLDRFEGKRFNSPNDLCIARSGAIYFTDPPYGLAGGLDSPVKELPYSGVYRYGPDGNVALLDKSFLYPNGVALSPDETVLYVSNTDAKLPIIRAYRLGADGLPTSFSTLFDAAALKKPGVPGMPDGMKIDTAGNLFAAGPGGILVLTKEGELLGVIGAGGRAMPNCAFGEDGRTLFLAATDCLARIRLKTRGGG
jgi:gluconolactonase